MKKNFDEERYKIINGDSLKVLDTFEENYFDSCVTDPPYGLTTITKRFGKENSAPNQYGKDGSFARLTKGFMGKEWDGSGIEYNVEFWRKVYKVLKPGAFLLAFGGSRTFYRIACAIEDAGFEIRDTIMWLYGSGFPKSLNIGLAIDKKNGIESEVVGTGKSGSNSREYQSEKNTTAGGYEIKQAQNEWAGWGTSLKPAYEPIIVARKPVEKSVIENVIKYGVGGINIDECRVPLEENYKAPVRSQESQDYANSRKGKTQCDLGNKGENAGANEKGRFPANVILTFEKADEQEVCGNMPNTKSNGGNSTMPDLDYVGKEQSKLGNGHKLSFGQVENAPRKQSDYVAPDDEGSAARYFYNAKKTTKDTSDPVGRFPANVILTYNEEDKDEVCGNMPYTSSSESEPNNDKTTSDMVVPFADHKSGHHFGDEGNACRYFYCAKASKKDRDSGLEKYESMVYGVGALRDGNRQNTEPKKNIHPTVKPVELMQYLIRLVTPRGGHILDPFNGSGSTGKAVAFENRESNKDYSYVGIELDKEYCEISKGRIDYALNKYEYDMIQDIKQEEEKTGQLSLFDFGEDYDL